MPIEEDKTMRKRLNLKLNLTLAVLLLTAALSAPAEVHEVTVRNFEFSPADLTITEGDIVRWVWESGSHTVTSGVPCQGDGLFNSPLSQANPEFEFTFIGQLGTIPYFCIPHCAANMVGSITVEPDFSGIDGERGDPTLANLTSLRASPNPFSFSTALRFGLGQVGHVRLTVHDPSGRLVTTLADRPFAAGTHALAWDGRSDAGIDLPGGIYFGSLTVEGSRTTAPILVLR
jgi:plastocyanin